MKNIKYIFLFIVLLFPIFIYADCNDEDLNEWVTTIEPTFVMSDKLNADDTGYAYFISISKIRDDVVVKVTDGDGQESEVERFYDEEYDYSDDGIIKVPKYDFYGVGCYTNLEEETYTIKVYGGENSKCKNELLKTMNYTVPRYNRLHKNAMCEEYPEHELCQVFSNKTQNMTEKQFEKKLKSYDDIKISEILNKKNIYKTIINYGLYVVIPFVLLTIVYFIKRIKIKKEKEEE